MRVIILLALVAYVSAGAAKYQSQGGYQGDLAGALSSSSPQLQSMSPLWAMQFTSQPVAAPVAVQQPVPALATKARPFTSINAPIQVI